MKRILPMALGLLLCHCGTEVGNGIAPPETKATGTPTSAPQAEGSTTDESTSGSSKPNVIKNSFAAACASPFAESIEGTFVNTAASTAFSVTLMVDGRKQISYTNSSGDLLITPAPAAGPYAIEALPASPQVTCSAVTTQTLNDGSLQRSVTLSNGDVVQWTLSAGKVISMRMTTLGMSEEIWMKR